MIRGWDPGGHPWPHNPNDLRRQAPPLPSSEAAKILRQAAEAYWRFAGSAPDPNPYRMLAMEYHEQALMLEAGT
jgi:hypothetical protein